MWWGYKGIPSAQMDSMGPGTYLGVLVCPKNLLIEHGYAEHPVDPTAYLRTVMLKLVLLKPGWWNVAREARRR